MNFSNKIWHNFKVITKSFYSELPYLYAFIRLQESCLLSSIIELVSATFTHEISLHLPMLAFLKHGCTHDLKLDLSEDQLLRHLQLHQELFPSSISDIH